MATYQIAEIQELPQEILDAVIQKKLVIFIGAGASRIIGCKGWTELAHMLVNSCSETPKINPSEGFLITYKESESLIRIGDPKKIITICKKLLEKNGNIEKYFEILNKSLCGKEELIQLRDIYKEIFEIPAFFVTTNVDTHLHKQFDPFLDLAKIVYKEKDFDPKKIELSKIYQIHGTILDSESLVFTVTDYLNRYNNEQIQNFLREIFKSKVMLFVGYGLSEFEILDFLVLKNDPSKINEKSDERPGKYVVLPFFEGEENIYELMNLYYKDLGIEVIPYAIDKNGHNQLYELIKYWNSQIRCETPFIIESNQKTDEILSQFDQENAIKLLESMRSNSPPETYFLSKLGKVENPLPWFQLLKEKGYFDPRNNPNDTKGSRQAWLIINYLENLTYYLIDNPSETDCCSLLSVINSILNYSDETDQQIENDYTDYKLFCIIFALPPQKIPEKTYTYFKNCLNSINSNFSLASEISEKVLEKFLKMNEKTVCLNLLKICFDHKEISNPKFPQINSLIFDNTMHEHCLSEIITKYSEDIIGLCGKDGYSIAVEKIEFLAKNYPNFLEYYVIQSVEESYSVYKNYPQLIVQFVSIYLVNSDSQQIKEIIEDFINQEHSIFKRLALNTINHKYEELKEIFWNYEGNFFDEYKIKKELFKLLENNCQYFSDLEQTKVISLINSMEFSNLSKKTSDSIEVEKYKAQTKKMWLSSLIKTENPEILKQIEYFTTISPDEIINPIQEDEVETGYVGFNLVEKEAEFLKMSNEDIVKYLENFNNEGYFDSTKNGLADSLKNIVTVNPQKITDNIYPFYKMENIYIRSLLWGFVEAWKLKKEINWSVILKYIYDLVQTDLFWSEETPDGEFGYKNEVVKTIADLIFEGTNNRGHAIGEEFISISEEILLILIKKNDSKIYELQNIGMSVENSPKGRILSAMISFSLRQSYLENLKTGNKQWNSKIKDYFTTHLDPSSDLSKDFSYTLGKYLRYLISLDRTWVEENIAQIFPKDNLNRWQSTMTAYLFFSPQAIKTIYELLKESGDLLNALNFDFTDDNAEEHLVWHIAVAYLNQDESIEDEDSLISQLLHIQNPRKIEILIKFFGMQRDRLKDEQIPLVFALWTKIVDILQSKESDPRYTEIIVSLLKWSKYIDNLNPDTVKLLKFSIRHFIFGYEFYHILDNFIRLSQKYPEEISEIFLECIKKGKIKFHDEDKMTEFVKLLYKNGAKTNANKICNIFTSSGYNYLKDIYRDNN